MITRSILVGPDRDAIAALAAALGVGGDDIYAFEQEQDYGFLAASRNGILFEPVDGDFAAACDVYVFDLSEAEVFAALAGASVGGRRMAMPDEVSPKSAFSYILFEDGQRLRAEIQEDELLEEFAIVERSSPIRQA